MIRILALALFAGLIATPALADCARDVATLKAKVAHERDPQVAAAVEKHLVKAEKNLRGSESECRNDVTRAWRAFEQPAAADAQTPPNQRQEKTAYITH